jgi:hypothetical protein
MAWFAKCGTATDTTTIIGRNFGGHAHAGVSVSLPPRRLNPSISPVEPSATCDLEAVLRGAGMQMQAMVANPEQFSANESPPLNPIGCEPTPLVYS